MIPYGNFKHYLAGEKARLDRLASSNMPDTGIVLKVLRSNPHIDRKSEPNTYSITEEKEHITMGNYGIGFERHKTDFNRARSSTIREAEFYPKGTLIPQRRHVFAVSPYDCKVLSDKLGVEVTPELLGANLVIGREDGGDYSLSNIPPNILLCLADENSQDMPRPPLAVLAFCTKQQGCVVTGNTIAHHYGRRELSREFIENAQDNRGIVLSVEYPNVDNRVRIMKGQKVFFKYMTGLSI